MIRRVVPLLVVLSAGCASLPFHRGEPRDVRSTSSAPRSAEDRERAAERLRDAMAEARAAVPVDPAEAPPRADASRRVWQAALDANGRRIVISRDARALWLMNGNAIEFRAPVAVGKHEPFSYRGRTYDFKTPVGRRKVLGKATAPIWVPPDWHYFEIAAEQGLEPVQLKAGSRIELEDGTRIEVRGSEVGRVNQFGNFWPFTPGNEIIFDGKIFIPPFGTSQRKVPEVLGTRKLDMGDGYLIHGTNMNSSIGDAVSHGCVRMFNEDVEWLYGEIATGTPVFVY
ncbi:MAG TPA: L,D-transpeptidase [Longimicrobiales bacterium]|nr:L,D-transpeptidase [Longimicrobiales bacterium]